MSVRLSIDQTRFNRFLRDLGAIDPRVEFRSTVRSVAQSVVQGAHNKTKIAKAGTIRKAAKARKFITMDGKVYYLANRYPTDLHRKIKARRQASLNRKLRARGLAKQSWLHVAPNPLAIKTTAQVRSANYAGRTYPADGTRTERGQAYTYSLTLTNRSPIVQSAGGKRALTRAMYGQARRFETLMSKQFYLTAASRAAAYPGIFVK